jgi:putative protease
LTLKGSDRQIKTGDQIKLLSPEGREKSVTLNNIWNAEREDMTMAQTGQIIFIPHVGGISVRTMVFKD